jgi:hypothetical protein
MPGGFQVGPFQPIPAYQQVAGEVQQLRRRGGFRRRPLRIRPLTLEEQPNKHLKHILDEAVREYYGDIIASDAPTAAKAEAGRIVKPFADKSSKLALAPRADTVDWTALEADAIQSRKLLDLWLRLLEQQELSDDDDYLLLLDS